MKRTNLYYLFAGAVLLLLPGACSEGPEPAPGSNPDGGERTVTVIATQEDALSRVSHTDDEDELRRMTVKWTEDDAFTLFGPGQSYKFTATGSISDDGKTASFKYSGIDSPSGTRAFFPHNEKFTKWSDCYFDATGQVQNGNGSMAHLADRHFMTAENLSVISGSVSGGRISFENRMAVLKFVLKFPVGEYPGRLTLSSGGLYRKKGVSDASLDEPGDVSLRLENVVMGADGTFTAYMAVIPGVLSGRFELRVECMVHDTPRIYSYSVEDVGEGFEYKAGRFYSSELELKPGGTIRIIPFPVFDNNTSASEGLTGSGDVLLIRSPEDLKLMINKVNAGDAAYAGASYRLATSIRIAPGTSWVPIGDIDTPFRGGFDGDGYTVHGEMAGNEDYVGFFGYVKGSGEDRASVRNLNVSAAVNVDRDVGVYAGGIAGYAGYADIENCRMSGSVSSSSSSSFPFSARTGGLAGEMENCSVTGSSNSGSVSSSSSSNAYSGGLVGEMSGSSVTGSSNSGAVSSSSSLSNAYSGGLAGWMGYESSVTCSSNYGSVSSSSSSSSNAFSGGLAGALLRSDLLHGNRNYSREITASGPNGISVAGSLAGNAAGGSGRYCYIYSCTTSVPVPDGSGGELPLIGRRVYTEDVECYEHFDLPGVD